MYNLGIDLGGTKIAAGVVKNNHKLLSFVVHPTDAISSRDIILSNIEKTAKTAVEKAGLRLEDISFTGLAIPACPEENGTVIPECPNLPRLGRVKIRSILMKSLGCKVALENDAKCFILGEWLAGIAKKAMNVVGVTLGTGVGVGFLLNGQLYRGHRWCSGEVWDQPMFEGGIIEDRISGRNLAKNAGAVSGKNVIQMARKGEQNALKLIASYGYNVGWLLSFIGRLLDPELFVLGGSLAKAYDLYKKEIDVFVKERWEIRLSKLGHKAPVIGAAMLLQHPYPVPS
ncbi:ROK family protein [Candidatus Bathyarchaeota archaeon]|nr:ROK family protein [Candidatus Bathyarchaeota archaeon]